MSIKDVLKKSFVSSISMAELSVSEILVVLGVTLLLSLYIFFIYRISIEFLQEKIFIIRALISRLPRLR